MNMKVLSLTAATLLFVVAAVAAYRIKSKPQKAFLPKEKPSITIAPPVDLASLDTLRTWATSIDLGSLKGTIRGVLTIYDPRDSLKRPQKLEYLISKNGQDCYCRYGGSETLNADGVFLYIDTAQRRIALGRQKALNTPSVIDRQHLEEAMSGEGYHVKATSNGNVRTIRLINPKHIACMEYALSYDRRTNHVVRVFARVVDTNEQGMSSTKVVDLELSGYDQKAKPEDYLNKDQVIELDHGKAVPAGKYKNFQLINID